MNKTETKPLTGQVAVVTGAGRGIGAAIALHLGAMGAFIVLTARDQLRLKSVAEQIRDAGGESMLHACDLARAEQIEEFGSAVLARTKRCDILVNCAGVGFIGKPLHEFLPEDWTATFQVNVRAPYLMIRAFAPTMIAAKYGHIVNVSSLAGRNPLPGGAAYAASKSALNGLTYSAAEELRPHNVRVSVVAPGSVNTGFGGVSQASSSEEEARAARKIQPADVADVVGMLVTQRPQSFISEVLVRPTTKP